MCDLDKIKVGIKVLKEEECSFVFVDASGLIKTDQGVGIKPIMKELRENKKYFKDGFIADKVIGKAAALMLVLSEVKSVHGIIMSKTAVEILANNKINYSYDNLVPFIENRTKTGACPLELCVEQIESPILAFDIIEETIAKLMAQNK